MISPFPPVPIRPAVLLQRWSKLTFLHWRYPAAEVQRLAPASLQVQTFEGSAWVGMAVFVLHGLRAPMGPPLPWFSRFPEANVRTYVQDARGGTGVWFFSLDCDRLAAVHGARAVYGLNYQWADIRVEGNVRYRVKRRAGRRQASAEIHIEPGRPIEPTQLDLFLTARFRLYSQLGGRLVYADIEHAPWPLHAARLTHLEQSLLEVNGLASPQTEPVVHYSPDLAVRVGRPRLLQ